MDAAEERYRRAQEIVHEAFAGAPDTRAEHVAAACGDDAELRAEVDWLIASVETSTPTDGFAGIGELAQAMLADARIEAAAPPQYRLLERLGEGGMGQVWMAERDDGTVRQRVALKMLRGVGTAREDARFAEEARILATLNHPNIAHLIEAGRDIAGEPFFAMEYVDGERIDRWCAARGIALRGRVELFLKVCAAVEYAHAQLTIHRDLKPANLLVTAEGEPKLLDFGIARLLDRSIVDTRTLTALQAMTPAYASPEQIEGRPLGTATDIYSLGVMLYELVAGMRPFDHFASDHALSNAIVSGEVLAPSRQARRATASDQEPTTPTRVRRIPADIDAIVLKALRREPAQRYASVGEFAADLRRYLAAQPVAARRGQWGYRAQRFLWRNRWSLAAASVMLALGATFVIEREAQLRRIEFERDRAEAIARFTNNLFDYAGSLRSRGSSVSVHEMLDRGAAELAVSNALSPDIKRALLLTMGRAYNSLVLGEQALPLLQSAQALPSSGNPVEHADLVAALGTAERERGHLPEGIADLTQAIALLHAASGTHDDKIDALRIEIASMHADIVDVPIEQTIAELKNIVGGLEVAPTHADAVMLQAYSALAQAYVVADDATRALPVAERAADLATRLYGADDVRASTMRAQLGLTLMETDPARAATLLREIMTDSDRFSGTVSITRTGIAYNYGKSLRLSGQLKEAATSMEQTVATMRQLGGPKHLLLLAALDELGVIYNLSGVPEKTEALFADTLPDFVEAAQNGGDNERDCYAMALATLGEAERMKGRYDEATAHFAQADQILGKLDVNGFKEDMLDLLEWTAQLQIDRRDIAAARTTLGRYDPLMRRQTPVSDVRAAKSRALHVRLDTLAQGALPKPS